MFAETMTALMRTVGETLELAREHELAPVIDGVQVYMPECGKANFQTASQFSRPTEFLQTLLDLIRIIYEPYPPGTFMLNSNWDFVGAALPSKPFRLGYLSMMSLPAENIGLFNERVLAVRMNQYGYTRVDAVATYFMVTVGPGRSVLQTSSEASRQFGVGISAHDTLDALALTASRDDEVGIPTGRVAVGVALDEGLEDRMRVSIWMILAGTVQANSA